MTERNHDDQRRQLIRQALAQRGRELRAQHPEWEPTPQCPPLPMFLSRHRDGVWEPRYQDHFATGCPYCRQQLQFAARLEAQVTAKTVVFVLVRSRSAVATMRRGDPNFVTAIPAGELRWQLVPSPPHRFDTDDGPAFCLPNEVASRSYDLPEGVAVHLRLDLLLLPGPQPNTFAPQVEVTPGPHRGKEPLRLLLRFAEECVREFVVRPHAVLNKACLRSDAVEALPAAVVEGWLIAEGTVSLHADFPCD